MAQRDQDATDRPLRLLTILAWIPAFALALPHGIETHLLCPAIGVLPMTFSVCIGIIHLAGKSKSRGINLAMDLFCALFLIAVLIPSWIFLADHIRRLTSVGKTMMGTYATVPMMLNFALHSWFVLREIQWRGIFRRKTCPHCSGDLSRWGIRGQGYIHVDGDETVTPGDPKEASSAIAHAYHDEEGRLSSSSQEPRPSADDEAARLV